MEWGCMQALIDFDGWRKWKDFSSANNGEADDLKSGKGKTGGGKKVPRTSGGGTGPSTAPMKDVKDSRSAAASATASVAS